MPFYKSLLRTGVIRKSGCWWVKSRSGWLYELLAEQKKTIFHSPDSISHWEWAWTQMFHSMGPKTGSEINFVSQLGSQKLSLFSSSKRSYCIYFEIEWSWNEVKDTRQFEISQCQFWLNVLISDKWSVRRRIWNFVEMEISLNFWGYFLVSRGRHQL